MCVFLPAKAPTDDSAHRSNLYLDGIVTVVDAMQLSRHLAMKQPHTVAPPRCRASPDSQPLRAAQDQVKHQIGYADVLLLNKTDLGAVIPPRLLLVPVTAGRCSAGL